MRISLTGDDVKLVVNTSDTVQSAKRKLYEMEEGIQEPSRQRWYFGGKLLGKCSYYLSSEKKSFK